jgi:hypothetical protein
VVNKNVTVIVAAVVLQPDVKIVSDMENGNENAIAPIVEEATANVILKAYLTSVGGVCFVAGDPDCHLCMYETSRGCFVRRHVDDDVCASSACVLALCQAHVCLRPSTTVCA